MTEVYPALKHERSKSPTLKPNLGHANGHDLSAAPRTKTESLAATSLSSLSISTSTSLMDIKAEHDVKLEDASPSQSPTLVADATPQNFKMSRSPTPPPSTIDGTMSGPSTPPPAAQSKTGRKAALIPVQLIGDLPVAREEAVRSFNEIPDNNYQYKTLGRSREILESMTCDCTYEHGVDSLDDACGPYSDCINRLTQVECLEDDCRCRSHCQNQRFQRKQYSSIEIVLTEKKGYGLRAEADLPKDTFIYEYVGDVVNPVSFKKRMREYAEEGIRHFYFMMLQKDEFIDATKSGGIGRFANHSCNPNCYVAKWTVGTQVRMGIFAKRNIQMHEELTFNYNVDRYGHQAQECFCGEPMCVGYIGGKTQTDIATMDDLYLDALGITDEEDLMELKGTKKKKGKKIDDPDFMPTMKAIVEKEVPKVVQAIRQTTSRKVLSKLLMRIKITEDQAALRQIMRLRGYSLMTNVLEDYASDMELVKLALECISTWPLLNRNKVQDSKVHVPVEAYAALENETTVKLLAQSLLDHWETLPVYNRIPKRAIQDVEVKPTESESPIFTPELRRKFFAVKVDDSRRKRRMVEPVERGPSPETQARMAAHDGQMKELERKQKEMRESVKAIIASAAEAAAAEEAAAAAAAAQAKLKAATAAEKAARKKDRAQKKTLTPEDKEANKEKRLMKLVGGVVVKCMSKYSKSFDRESFKKHAKEIIADKEKKSSSYRDNRLDTLSEEKVVKIKKFAKEYIAKVIRKMEKSGKMLHSSSTSTAQDTPSTSMQTPNSNDGGDTSTQPLSMFEEAMGMDLDSGSDEDEDVDMDEGDEGQGQSITSPSTMPPPLHAVWGHRMDVLMDTYNGPQSASIAVDPRRRPSTDD
ncbi:hypothetical protein GALMADRAFT_65042 [Galerina marginata CBS 339.88]|uniref:Histone-lysine N-methyltransferase, H3 lysine-36 specific n=1 Tax=Galerina marginata (strain CBS 339.88) TaxID=685588 RepID=A0A067T5J8_GALM3|nr:hypothetical protein GALMADRAFT_65042 [Galerina marginata CBS 339.88]